MHWPLLWKKKESFYLAAVGHTDKFFIFNVVLKISCLCWNVINVREKKRKKKKREKKGKNNSTSGSKFLFQELNKEEMLIGMYNHER